MSLLPAFTVIYIFVAIFIALALAASGWTEPFGKRCGWAAERDYFFCEVCAILLFVPLTWPIWLPAIPLLGVLFLVARVIFVDAADDADSDEDDSASGRPTSF